MKIVDAHFHVWRQSDLPWLAGPMQPRIFGPYEPIRRDYSIAEYRADIAGGGVDKSVYVQANWPAGRAEDEVAWIETVALETGWPHAIVGYADMTVPDVRPALDRLARYPRMRGIRQQFHWHENPLYRFAPEADLCRNPDVIRNISRLSDYGWVFELQVFASQMAGAAELARHCQDVTFVLQHAGMMEDMSETGRALWLQNMALLAGQPNVVAKLSGFGTFIQRNDPAHVAWLIAETVRLFGADRCLFGSNFPIEKIWTDYASLIKAHREGAIQFSEREQQSIFNATASRVYRL